MFKQLVSGAKRLAVGGGSSTAPDVLFPRVQPEVDGEDCLRDCDSCSIQYPKSFKIEEHDELYGHVKGWATHVLVATGKSDWVRDVADEKGSVMEALDRAEKPSNGVSSVVFQTPSPSFCCAHSRDEKLTLGLCSVLLPSDSCSPPPTCPRRTTRATTPSPPPSSSSPP